MVLLGGVGWLGALAATESPPAVTVCAAASLACWAVALWRWRGRQAGLTAVAALVVFGSVATAAGVRAARVADNPLTRLAAERAEVSLDGTYKFHRAARVTSTDQTTLRFGVDYHDILPRITLFTFTSTDRNMPANLRLNLEEAVLGVKFDLVRPGVHQLDLSFAPVWNFRSIVDPNQAGGATDETTSKLRGSLRARAGLHLSTWSLLDTFEFLPTIYGDDVANEDDFWHRTVVRNTVTFDVTLTKRLSFHEEFKYTWDSAMRAQATCPDSENPLCLGYAFASTTALSVNLEL